MNTEKTFLISNFLFRLSFDGVVHPSKTRLFYRSHVTRKKATDLNLLRTTFLDAIEQWHWKKTNCQIYLLEHRNDSPISIHEENVQQNQSSPSSPEHFRTLNIETLNQTIKQSTRHNKLKMRWTAVSMASMASLVVLVIAFSQSKQCNASCANFYEPFFNRIFVYKIPMGVRCGCETVLWCHVMFKGI